jgi:isopenicillin N synthase-like dioxygenase
MSSARPVSFVSSDSPVVVLDYSDLESSSVDLSESLKVAYGPDGLGILGVRGVPQLNEKRAALLPLARDFALLPDSIKNLYEHPLSHYNFGWSHGKETLAGGKPDYAKGSYYANPLLDDPFNAEPAMIAKYPSFCAPNIWPTPHLPSLEPAFKSLGQLIVSVGLLLARHCDKAVKAQFPSYPDDHLYRIIKNSRNPKARLLHYFPAVSSARSVASASADSMEWCGWHNDHGSLTGLTSAMFINSSGAEVSNPDPKAGLYIKSRTGQVVKAVIPPDCLAFQIGETQQIHSGGLLQATPHAVQAAEIDGISRETFAVFMEPEIHEPMSMPNEGTIQAVCEGSGIKYLPPGVPPLSVRWQNGISFGEFTNQTLDAYHPENKK